MLIVPQQNGFIKLFSWRDFPLTVHKIAAAPPRPPQPSFLVSLAASTPTTALQYVLIIYFLLSVFLLRARLCLQGLEPWGSLESTDRSAACKQ